MLVRYIYRTNNYGTFPRQHARPAWYVADQDDLMKVFKYEDVMWMLVQNLMTGEYKWWDGHRWKPTSKFAESFFNAQSDTSSKRNPAFD